MRNLLKFLSQKLVGFHSICINPVDKKFIALGSIVFLLGLHPTLTLSEDIEVITKDLDSTQTVVKPLDQSVYLSEPPLVDADRSTYYTPIRTFSGEGGTAFPFVDEYKILASMHESILVSKFYMLGEDQDVSSSLKALDSGISSFTNYINAQNDVTAKIKTIELMQKENSTNLNQVYTDEKNKLIKEFENNEKLELEKLQARLDEEKNAEKLVFEKFHSWTSQQ